ncbi:MAG TPA: VWA domain-containing protein [Chloroflexota bacterium]
MVVRVPTLTMIVFTSPLALLLLPPVVVLLVVIWRGGYANLSPRRNAVALGVRLVLVLLVVLGLAGMSLQLPQSRQATVFVADLSASDFARQSEMQTAINAALQHRPAGYSAGVVSVGRQAVVEQPVAPLDSFDGFQTTVDPNYTNLEGALELSGAILPDGYRHRVLVMSDGQQNVGDALSAARLLRSRGIRVDVMPVQTTSGPDVRVDRVDLPSQLRLRESFSLSVSIHASIATTTALDVFRDHTLVLSKEERLNLGENTFIFSQPPLTPGFHTYQVHITPAIDSVPQNNTGSAFTSVQGPPRVLIIASDPSKAVDVLRSLHSTGMQASVQRPDTVVPTLGYLQHYAAVVIVDTAADVLGTDLIAQLVPYVRDLGHGLVVIGGEESYGMGGYGQTPLETALPVKMDLPKRKDLPSAAVSLVIESLESDTQVNISKQAGKGVVSLLTQGDQIAVNDTPDDGSAGFAVPLQYARNKTVILHAMDAMQPGDPMTYTPYLQASFNALKRTTARVKHIILLGDGDAEDANYEKVVKRIRAGGVTVSTVATNGQGFADFQTMRNIARWGGGRYYQADNAASIPQIFLREARTVSRSGIITGKFFPQELSANPMLQDLHGVPPLYGYVATTPKPTGELVLVSKKLDPVLAGWQFGLGRSVAWTSDASGLWTRDWLQAPGANRFWANLVSWTLPATQGGRLFITATGSQGQGQVSVDTSSALGANPAVTAHIVDPSLHTTSVTLQPYAPGKYRGQFPAKAQGSYFVTVEGKGAGHGAVGQAGLAVPYSAEYRTSGTNLPFLRTLAAAGGGSIVNSPLAAWQNNLATVLDQSSLTALLWLLALLLLPVDIGVRRLVVDRRDLAAVWAALPFGRRRIVSPEAVVPTLDVLRTRRAGGSSQRRPASDAVAVPGTLIPATSPTKQVKGDTTKKAPATLRTSEKEPTPEDSTAGRLLASKRRRR